MTFRNASIFSFVAIAVDAVFQTQTRHSRSQIALRMARCFREVWLSGCGARGKGGNMGYCTEGVRRLIQLNHGTLRE